MRSETNGDESLLITADGYAKRRRELDELRTQARSALAERLREAREDGDLDDNPALYDLFEEQAQLERRIALLESQLAVAEIVSPAADGLAGIGSIVRVRDDAVQRASTSSLGHSSRTSATVACRSKPR